MHKIYNNFIIFHYSVCKTKDGPTAGGKACVFPFSFDGVTYNGCPSWPADASETWCSTKVDTAGNHVTGGGNFGFCSADCPSNTGSLLSKYFVNCKMSF